MSLLCGWPRIHRHKHCCIVQVFLIEVGTSSRTFTVRRRYREFLSLHRSLRRRLAHVPVFPGKYLLTKKTFQVIEQRRVDLQSYMKVSSVRVWEVEL